MRKDYVRNAGNETIELKGEKMEAIETWVVIIGLLILGFIILKILSGISNGVAVTAKKDKDGSFAFKIFIFLIIFVIFMTGYLNRN